MPIYRVSYSFVETVEDDMEIEADNEEDAIAKVTAEMMSQLDSFEVGEAELIGTEEE
jgi:hypothetical protein